MGVSERLFPIAMSRPYRVAGIFFECWQDKG